MQARAWRSIKIPAAVVAMLVASCAAPVPIDNAPCPCPTGFTCDISRRCVAKAEEPLLSCRDVPGGLAPQRLVLLSPEQYAASLRALSGYEVAPGQLPPPDEVPSEGFDTESQDKQISAVGAAIYRDHALRVASKLFDDSWAKSCPPGVTSPACQDLLRSFAARAFRRPLSADEGDALTALVAEVATKADPSRAVRAAVQAILQSPRFLYRWEVGALPSPQSTVALSSPELATQLSFMLAGEPPDATLNADAAADRLTDRAIVAQHARRLLAGAGARRTLLAFVTQMLHIERLDRQERDPATFPRFAALKRSMLGETNAILDDMVWNGHGDAVALFTGRVSYVDATLGVHYGAAVVDERSGFVARSVPHRRGLLSNASFLTAIPQDGSGLPLRRGLVLRNSFFCTTFSAPPLPPSVRATAAGAAAAPATTARERYAASGMNTRECAPCHLPMMQIGFGLEQFDDVGRYRATDSGKPIDTTVELDVGTFSDTADMVEHVLGSDDGRACFIGKLAGFAYGLMDYQRADSCIARSISRRFRGAPLDVRELLVALTQDDAFYFRAAP